MVSRFLIYGLKDPRDGAVRYIGKSCSGLARPREHARPSKRESSTYKSRWLAELERQGLTYEVVVLEQAQCAEDLSPMECFWIAQGRGMGWRLTNLTPGGDGNANPTAETRAKWSALRKGKKRPARSEEWCERLRQSAKRRRHSDETRARMSDAHNGKPRLKSLEWRAKQSALMAGRKHSEETKAKMRLAQQARRLRESQAGEEHGAF
jgi:hypothetical protein